MSVMVGGVIEMVDMIYVPGLDEDILEYSTDDMIPGQPVAVCGTLGSITPKARRVRTGVYTRTPTPPLLGFFEYELLGWKR